jgi:ABC-type branched-subunit amino acid transport system ATPase component
MTVAENLRVFGTSLGRDSERVRLGVDAVFEAFPVLGERRNQRASSLSGGEQQMLGLGKAYLTRPKLLLIDELSLGLAPMVTAELVESVKRLNAQGIAVVLVEQSVNVALSLVNHAYFMEKGEIRFDGRATDLVDRPDLLRSIFLEGASDRLSATGTPDGRRPPTPHQSAGSTG